MLKKIFNYRNATILLTIEFLMMLFRFGYFFAFANGPSMNPTFSGMFQPTISEALPNTINTLQYGDVVVFKNRQDKDVCKRLIGLPGDHIIVNGDTVIRNGEILNEPYVKTETNRNYQVNVILEADEYFLLGDNRGNSSDSRQNGPFKAKDFVAKVVWYL